MLSIQSYGNVALKLLENGYTPIPIVPETKRPIISDWSNIKNDYNQIENLSSEHLHNLVLDDGAIGFGKSLFFIQSFIVSEVTPKNLRISFPFTYVLFSNIAIVASFLIKLKKTGIDFLGWDSF